MTESDNAFDQLKKQFENLKDQRNKSLEDYSDRIAAGLKTHQLAKNAFGEDSMEYAKMEEAMRDKNLHPKTEVLAAINEHGEKAVEELENLLFEKIKTEWISNIKEEKRKADKVKIKNKSRQVRNTTERTVKIRLKEIREKGEQNKRKTVYSR